jgi:CRISPR system Cascade subunit CasC
VLISHSPSCLNRDDMNMQKTAVFGGTTRVRISSQSLKRAFRCSDYYLGKFSKSQRTRRLLDALAHQLGAEAADDVQKEAIEQCALYAAAIFEGKTKIPEITAYQRANSGHIETQIIPFSSSEIAALRQVLLDVSAEAEKSRAEVMLKAIKRMEDELRSQIDLDVALSGRMANSGLIYPVDGALAVAHAMTTHAVAPQDVDWFTAVDDLTEGEGETGAGHLNTQQFSAGVFYRYASLNLRQLQLNLGLIEKIDADETAESRKRALAIAADVLHLMASVVPTAKQQSYAAHNPADFAIVSFAHQPISLANAFERPVERARDGGYLAESIGALAHYWQRINSAYGLDERARAFATAADAALGGQPAMKSLQGLKDWISADGAE